MPSPPSPTWNSDRSVAASRARLRNAADFVVRTALGLVPNPAGGSVWVLNDSDLELLVSVSHRRAALPVLKTLLAGIITRQSVEESGTLLPRVDRAFGSAVVLPVPVGPEADMKVFLLLASERVGAFGGGQDLYAVRLAAQLGTYWAGMSS